MRVSLVCDGRPAPVSPFVGHFIGGVCRAITSALKAPSQYAALRFELEADAVRLFIDGQLVDLERNQGFAHILTRATLRGMVQPLKGVEADKVTHIEIFLEHEKDQGQNSEVSY